MKHHASIKPRPNAEPDPAETGTATIAGRALSRRTWMGLAAGAGCGLFASLLAPLASAQQGAPAGPSFYDNFAGMRLLDQSGKTLQLQSLTGRVVLFNFIFTACSTVCPVQTHALAQMQRELTPNMRRRVHLVSVSLDALSDTPQTLRAFAAKHRVDHANWSFVTGRPEDIYRLSEALWLFRNGKGQAPLEDHNTSLWLVDAQGVLRTRYGGNPPDTGRLTRELVALADLSAIDKPRASEQSR